VPYAETLAVCELPVLAADAHAHADVIPGLESTEAPKEPEKKPAE
jgi:hypothetical protein